MSSFSSFLHAVRQHEQVLQMAFMLLLVFRFETMPVCGILCFHLCSGHGKPQISCDKAFVEECVYVYPTRSVLVWSSGGLLLTIGPQFIVVSG